MRKSRQKKEAKIKGKRKKRRKTKTKRRKKQHNKTQQLQTLRMGHKNQKSRLKTFIQKHKQTKFSDV